MRVSVRIYTAADEEALFELLRSEGEAWSDYHAGGGREKYKIALNNSIVYVLLADNILCGYVRLKDDDGFGIYVYDLLVNKDHRGKGYGRKLLEQAHIEYPNDTVYVMSDVDEYYEKLGYSREGSIFRVAQGCR